MTYETESHQVKQFIESKGYRNRNVIEFNDVVSLIINWRRAQVPTNGLRNIEHGELNDLTERFEKAKILRAKADDIMPKDDLIRLVELQTKISSNCTPQ